MINGKDRAMPARMEKIRQKVEKKKRLSPEQALALLLEAHELINKKDKRIEELESQVERLLRRSGGLILPGGLR